MSHVSSRASVEMSVLGGSPQQLQASLPQQGGQFDNRSCAWLEKGANIRQLAESLKHLNRIEKDDLIVLANNARKLEAKIHNGPNAITRLRLWTADKLGHIFTSLRDFKADVERDLAYDKQNLDATKAQLVHLERMNKLREDYKPSTIDSLALSGNEKKQLKELLKAPAVDFTKELNNYLENMRNGRNSELPLSPGERVAAVDALLAKHELNNKFNTQLTSILNIVRPNSGGDSVEYLSYSRLAGQYNDNKNKTKALEALEAFIRTSLSDNGGNPDKLRQALIASVHSKEDELLLAKMMIDVRYRVANNKVSAFNGAGADPLVGFVSQPLRNAAAASQDDMQHWDIGKADFLSMTTNPEGCMTRAAKAAAAGGVLMESWLFMAADAVDQEQAHQIASKEFDGGAGAILQAGEKWFKAHPAQLLPLARPLYDLSAIPAVEHTGLGKELESAIHQRFSSLSRKLNQLTVGSGSQSAAPEAVQAFATVLQNKFRAETGGFSDGGELADFAKVAEHLNDDTMLSLPESITQKWSPDTPAAKRLSNLKNAQSTEIANRKALFQANDADHEAYRKIWILDAAVKSEEHEIEQLKQKYGELILSLPGTESEVEKVNMALSAAEKRLQEAQQQILEAQEIRVAAQKVQSDVIPLLLKSRQ